MHQQAWCWRRALRLRARRRSRRVGDSVIIVEVATVSDASADESEKVRRHHRRVGLLRSSILALHRERKGESAGEIIEDTLGAVAQIDEVGVGNREVTDIALAQIAGHHYQAVGFPVRQRPQQHGISHAENSGSCPNSQRYGQRRRQGKHWALAQHTSCNYKIAKIHPTPPEGSTRSSGATLV